MNFSKVIAISTTPKKGKHKSQKIDVVVAPGEKYSGIQDLTSEELQGVFSGGVPSSQAVGMVKEQIGSKWWNGVVGFLNECKWQLQRSNWVVVVELNKKT